MLSENNIQFGTLKQSSYDREIQNNLNFLFTHFVFHENTIVLVY